MLGLFTAPETIIFSAALLLLLAIGLIETLGLGASGIDAHIGIDLDHDGILGWLGVGRVPLLVILVAFLAAFGVIGLAGQQIAESVTGHPLPALIAVPGAAVLAIPLTSLLGRLLGRIMPHDETTAVGLDELVGLAGTITVGTARPGSPARARVVDPHGQAHNVLVEPDSEAEMSEGQSVLLVRREADHFRAIPHEPYVFSNWIDR